MSRVTLLLVLLVGMAIPAGAPAAQSVELPSCDWRLKLESLVAGAIPDFTGCPAGVAARLLALHRRDIKVLRRPDEAVSGIRRGIVTGQSQDGSAIILSESTGAGYPPRSVQVAGTGAPSPPPVGQGPSVIVPTPPPSGPVPGTSTPPPPLVETPRFSISGSPRVTEGEPLIFQINRDGDDSKPQLVIIEYGGEAFLVDPPESIEFPAGQTSMSLQLATAEDPAQNGERRVDVQLEEVQGGRVTESRSASGFIDDAAATPPGTTSYSIRLEGVATRGQPITFVVSRSGPLAAAEIVYDVTPARGDAPESGAAVRILFGQGVPNWTIIVPPEGYDLCGDPVTVTLQRGSSEETARSVEFSDFTPAQCEVIPAIPLWKQALNWLNANLPWWPLIAAIVAAVVLGTGIRKLLKPKPLPPVTAKCKIDHGPGELGLDSASVGRWPAVTALVTMERVTGPAPSPLPIMEPSDG